MIYCTYDHIQYLYGFNPSFIETTLSNQCPLSTPILLLTPLPTPASALIPLQLLLEAPEAGLRVETHFQEIRQRELGAAWVQGDGHRSMGHFVFGMRKRGANMRLMIYGSTQWWERNCT